LEGIENTPGRFDGLCLLANQYLEAAFYLFGPIKAFKKEVATEIAL
jgi:hypothetical protein